MKIVNRMQLWGSIGGLALLVIAASALARSRPAAVSPGSGAGTVIAGACPTFSWGAVSGAETYEIVAYQVPEGVSPVTSPSDLTELWRVTLPGTARSWSPSAEQCFTHGGRYAWAVRAVVNGQPGVWSEANLFTIEKAPTAEEVRGAMATMRRYLNQSRIANAEVAPANHSAASSTSSTIKNAVEVRPSSRMSESMGGKKISQSREATAADLRALQKILLPRKGMRGLDAQMHSASETASTPSLGSPSLSVDGNVSLGASSNVFKNGSAFLWDDTTGNLALGDSALASVSGTATKNTALGKDALEATTAGSFPNYGSYNTAVGYKALFSNTTGYRNTATGEGALHSNTTGYSNTATGDGALYSNKTGGFNDAHGEGALHSNTTGVGNTATGYGALYDNTTGRWNTAVGSGALSSNGTTSKNTAVGAGALFRSFGSNNIAIGYDAGYRAGLHSDITSDNIFIGNPGGSADSGVIKIGTSPTQTATYIAGITGVAVTGDPVYVSSSGQLGVGGTSSRRFKEDIRSIGDVTAKLMKLRPVSFHYKPSFSKDRRLQYGLIAEEVAKVFPELVVDDAKGRPERIRYELLTPLLLRELQEQAAKASSLSRLLTEQGAHLQSQDARAAIQRKAMTHLQEQLAEWRFDAATQKVEVERLELETTTAKAESAAARAEGAVQEAEIAALEKRDSVRDQRQAQLEHEVSTLKTLLASTRSPAPAVRKREGALSRTASSKMRR